jgi:hypothetical protein
MSDVNWKYQFSLGLKFDILIGIAFIYSGFAIAFFSYLTGFDFLGIDDLCIVQFSETRIYLCSLLDESIFIFKMSALIVAFGFLWWRVFQKTRREYRKSE